MADTKGSALTAATILRSTDLLLGVDVTDTTMSASGTTKRYSPAVIAGGLPSNAPIWTATGAGPILTNSTTETSMITGMPSTGSLVIPAGTLVAGKLLRFVWFATASSGATSPLQLNTYLGATKVMSGTSTAAISAATGLTIMNVLSSMLIQASGTGGKLLGMANAVVLTTPGAGTSSIYQFSGGGPISQVSLDLTAALTFDFRMKLTTSSSSSDIFQLQGAALYIDG